MSAFEFLAKSESDTGRLGAALARLLSPGLVVALVGELGSGKTRLVQAVAEPLGVDRAEVTSPTFVLIQEYHGRQTIYHFDTYRLRDEDEFLELGAGELFESDGVCFVEWADRVADLLPADHLRIEIETVGETERLFRFTAHGPVSAEVVRMLAVASREGNR